MEVGEEDKLSPSSDPSPPAPDNNNSEPLMEAITAEEPGAEICSEREELVAASSCEAERGAVETEPDLNEDSAAVPLEEEENKDGGGAGGSGEEENRSPRPPPLLEEAEDVEVSNKEEDKGEEDGKSRVGEEESLEGRESGGMCGVDKVFEEKVGDLVEGNIKEEEVDLRVGDWAQGAGEVMETGVAGDADVAVEIEPGGGEVGGAEEVVEGFKTEADVGVAEESEEVQQETLMRTESAEMVGVDENTEVVNGEEEEEEEKVSRDVDEMEYADVVGDKDIDKEVEQEKSMKTESAEMVGVDEKTDVVNDEEEEQEKVSREVDEMEDAVVVRDEDLDKEVEQEKSTKTESAEMVGVDEKTEVMNGEEEEEEKVSREVDEMEDAGVVGDEDLDKEVGEEMVSVEGGEEVELGEPEVKDNVVDTGEGVEVTGQAGEEEEEEVEEEEEEGEGEEEEVNRTVGGKRKRGKGAGKGTVRALTKKKNEEDVCFICFDGGNLVLCDRRGCPKAYHPSCVNHDEAFFQTKGRWNCGWHQCSICQKNAHYTCFTCTYSLCKGCIKDAVIFCIRGNKGFCETCIRTVMLIENSNQEHKDTAQVDFDDKSSWEFLFKDYWIDLKERLSITSEELAEAKNPWKGSDLHAGKTEGRADSNDGGSGSDSSLGNADVIKPKKRKAKKLSKSRDKYKDSPTSKRGGRTGRVTSDDGVEWASKELLELVMHMKNGDKSVCSQFDVQALLLEYITRNKLRDPRRKSHIICDSRLEKLFGKPRVGHFEMLKLLESHFLLKEDSQADDLRGSIVDTEANQSEADGNSEALAKTSKDKRRKSRKRGDSRGMYSNTDDFAAIDIDNINLIFLKRSLVEALLDDAETFHDKVVGAFVRLRISGSNQMQDLYRLVQVVGTTKQAASYRVGKKTTDFALEILNLNKTEVVSIDIISNQGFTEDECKRLRQSIKCGLINRLTVGDIQEKAIALQAVRVQDTLEAEITRFSHLRDRASDMGRRKELRECVEKLQLLKSPEERQRRLEDLPDIHSDPKMDPSYESEDDEDNSDERRQESFLSSRGDSFSRRASEPISPRLGGFASNDSRGGTRSYLSVNRELSRSTSGKGFSNKGDGSDVASESLWTSGRNREPLLSQSWDRPKTLSGLEIQNSQPVVASEPVPKISQEVVRAPPPSGVLQSGEKLNETEKIWHYKDPSGKVQGPFSMVQLRKWNTTGYFPADLRIWKAKETQDDSILLSEALLGNVQKSHPVVDNSFVKTQTSNSSHPSSMLGRHGGDTSKPISEASISTVVASPATIEIPKNSQERWSSETNLPSPTPSGPAQTGSGMKDRSFRSRWSSPDPQPASSVLNTGSFSRSNGQHQPSDTGELPTPTPRVGVTTFAHEATPTAKPASSTISQLRSVPDSISSSVQPAFDVKSLQNLVQQVASNPLIGTHGWMAGTVSKPEMNTSPTVPGNSSQPWGSTPSQKTEPNSSVSVPMQPGPYGNWGNTPTPVRNVANYATGNPTGPTQMAGAAGLVSSTTWRAPIPAQLNVQPSAPSNVQWGMGNQSSTQSAWGPPPVNTSTGWGVQLPSTQNPNWTAPGQGPTPGNGTPGWPAAVQGQATGNPGAGWAASYQGQGYGSTFQGWTQPGQGPAPVNPASGWGPAGQQGSSTGNANPSPGWSSMSPGGNTNAWGSDRNQNGNRPAGHGDRDRSSHGGDSGHGGGRSSWNRQSSLSREDSSRAPFKGNRVCKYHESGHCKKGSACDYLHG